MNKVAIVVLSGGLDSTTCAYIAKNKGFDIVALHFNYGQKTLNKELETFRAICDVLDIETKKRYEIDLPFFTKIGCSALTDKDIDVPIDGLDDNIPITYVPFRNGIFLSIATALAIKYNSFDIFIGVVSEDGSGYPDCTKEFIKNQQNCINEGANTKHHITIQTPLIDKTKEQIVHIAKDLSVAISKTWSCYKDEFEACGVCDSCRLRLNGFNLAGETDPIDYE